MESPGLYIHVPFCKTKCPYCDFYSITGLSLTDAWLEALEKEIGLYASQFTAFDSLYVGGGTPSVLTARQLGRLFHALRVGFVFLPDTEITVELNPDDVNREKLEALRNAGVNRLSIGVQSFDEKELLFLQRRHTGRAAGEAVKLAQAMGFTDIGIDLMYGFAGQSRESWLRTLESALGLGVSHLSCYQFTLEERTPYGRLLAEGRLEPIGEEQERDFFLLTSDVLRGGGFIHYEVSNYAADARHISRHNSKYWRHVPYLGLGPAAHSFKDDVRWWNHRSVEAYVQSLSQGIRPVEGSETLTAEQLRLERLCLGFRTARGVSINDVCGDAPPPKALSQLRRSGYVRVRQSRIIPTEKGYLIADRLPLMFDLPD